MLDKPESSPVPAHSNASRAENHEHSEVADTPIEFEQDDLSANDMDVAVNLILNGRLL